MRRQRVAGEEAGGAEKAEAEGFAARHRRTGEAEEAELGSEVPEARVEAVMEGHVFSVRKAVEGRPRSRDFGSVAVEKLGAVEQRPGEVESGGAFVGGGLGAGGGEVVLLGRGGAREDREVERIEAGAR